MFMTADYVARMETQLRRWDADFAALAMRSAKVGAGARAAYRKQVADLRVGRDIAQKRLDEMRRASESAGEQMQSGMDAAWNTMQKALKAVSS